MLRTTLAHEEAAVRNAMDELLIQQQQQQQQDGLAMTHDQETTLKALLETPRRRFLFLEAGGVAALVNLIKAHGLDVPLPASLLSLACLLLLCCQDTESAVAVGLLGLHPWLQRVLALDNQEEDGEKDEAVGTLRECAEKIASRCARVRGGFPLRTLALCSDSALASLRLPVRVPIHCHSSTTTISKAQEHQPKDEGKNDALVVLITPVADRMSSQADTGYFLWPAATILARFIVGNSSSFAGKRVMEIGAGLGLCGLVAGRVTKEVLLTDYNLACLQQLQEHVRLNCDDGVEIGGGEEGVVVPKEGVVAAAAAALACSSTSTMKVRWLDWDRLEAVSASMWQVSEEEAEEGEEGEEEEENEETNGRSSDDRRLSEEEDEAFGRPRWSSGLLDVVIGSDCICDEPSAVGVARLLSLTLKPETGVGYLTAPFPQHRYGVHALPRELAARGLSFEQDEVTDEGLLEGLPEAAYMRFHLFTVRRKEQEQEQEQQ